MAANHGISEVDAVEVVDPVSSIPTDMEEFLTYVGEGDKPWYLTSSKIYHLVKSTISSLPKSKDLFEKSLTVVSLLTKYIDANTYIHVVLDVEKAHEIINNLDNVLAQLLTSADDEFDILRSKFVSSIRRLIASLVRHKEWAETILSEKAREAGEATAIIAIRVRSHVEQIGDVLKEMLTLVRNKYPDTFHNISTLTTTSIQTVHAQTTEISNFVKATSKTIHSTVHGYAHGAKVRVDQGITDSKTAILETERSIENKVYESVLFWLHAAQPFLQIAAARTEPYVTQAIAASDPYVAIAKPYVEPIVAHASKLQEHKYVGPYVAKAVAVASVALEETKAYLAIPAQPVQGAD